MNSHPVKFYNNNINKILKANWLKEKILIAVMKIKKSTKLKNSVSLLKDKSQFQRILIYKLFLLLMMILTTQNSLIFNKINSYRFNKNSKTKYNSTTNKNKIMNLTKWNNIYLQLIIKYCPIYNNRIIKEKATLNLNQNKRKKKKMKIIII